MKQPYDKLESPGYAFLLAAGFGTRMEEHTRNVPKPMLAVGGVPLIVYSLYTLKKLGIENVVVNTHYKAGTLHELLKKAPFNVSISHETEILGTAGGLKKALTEKLIPANKNFYLLNTDIILSPPDMNSLIQNFVPGKSSYLFVKKKDPGCKETGWDLDTSNHLHLNTADGKYYYMGFSIINPLLLYSIEPGRKFELGGLWKTASAENMLMGQEYTGKAVSCGNKTEYENIKDHIPDFYQDNPGFQDFIDSLKINRLF